MDFRNATFKKFTPYTPGEQPSEDGWIKLNTNELPYPPSAQAMSALQAMSQNPHLLRKYSHPFAEPLRSELAKFWQLPPQQVLVTNGSDEGLLLICRVFLQTGETAAFPEITYSLYKTLVAAVGISFFEIPPRQKNTAQGKNPLAVDLAALENSPAKIIFLPNPNAPTGEFIPPQELKNTIQKSKKLWVIDEAYNDFVESDSASMATFLSQLPNLIVLRTFSKSYGLAGMRLGYALSDNPNTMQGLYSAKDSYNIDAVAARVGLAAFNDKKYFAQTRAWVMAERKVLQTHLQELGFFIIPSQANFILASPPSPVQAKELLQKLREQKILLRYFSLPHLENYLRITVGSAQENQTLIECLRAVL